jgi:D-glycero-D-manno-heptose 1,7-bisphosphate phosphatase
VNEVIMKHGRPYPPRNLREIQIIDGVKEAISLLKEFGFEIVVVTNQPDVQRGIVSKGSVEEINDFLMRETGIEHFFVCFHDDFSKCDCRKPKPGLLLDSAKILDIDLSESFMVGDRWRDIEAGQSAGCYCFFLDYGYSEMSPKLPFTRVSSLHEAAHLITENLNGNFNNQFEN